MAPLVFVPRSAVIVFALVAAYPWTAGTPRPAITTPAVSGSVPFVPLHGKQSEHRIS